MDEFAIPIYPINDYGPAMKGMAIGGLGILHVFIAQFAIGGGMLLTWFQHLAASGKEPLARRFVDSYFVALLLVSFVIGALTGVGMWLTSIQVSPRTIGLMVEHFHWLWAAEWTFFCVEVVAGYAFYRYSSLLDDRTRLRLLAVYSLAGWMSLFLINGILAWQLTPGIEEPLQASLWSGFFNASFWPSLAYRTVSCLVIAGLAAMVVINLQSDLDRDQKRRLINAASRLLLPMLAMPVLGLWFLAVLPEDSRSWVLGGSIAMTMFLGLATLASLAVAAYVAVALWRQRLFVSGPTATLLLGLAFVASAGGEFVREGVRKPYTIRHALYANSVTPDEVAVLREVGIAPFDPYPVRDGQSYPDDGLRLGRQVYRMQCSVCHTVAGANGIVHLVSSWTLDQLRHNIAQLQHTKSFMPPFAGTARDCEALVHYLTWEAAGRPAHDPVPEDPAALSKIEAWLTEAGVEAGRHNRLRSLVDDER